MLFDLKLAWRRLRNAPLFTSTAIATLALAIGANTAIFSIADAVLFRPLPYADPDRVRVLATVDSQTGQRVPSVRFAYIDAINRHHRGFGEVGLRGPTTMSVHIGPDETEWIESFSVTPEYFRVLGVRPLRGRLFDADDASQPGRRAIISFECWQGRFAGDPNIIGRSVVLGTETREIIGVLPQGFVFPATALNFLYSSTGRTEFITVQLQGTSAGAPPIVARGLTSEPVVRLEDGVTDAQARAELESIVAPLREGRAETMVLESPRDVLFPTGRPIMLFLVAAAALVLLIGCANLANMLLARTRGREREVGMYAALGATRLRIVRPILFETLIVSSAAASLAFLMTAATFETLLRQVPPIAYGSALVQFDVRVALFAAMLGVVAGFAFAVAPALWSVRQDVQTLVKWRTQGAGRTYGHPMVVVQVAVSIVLVFGAAIAARAFVDALRVPLGFAPDRLVTINAQPNRLTAPDLRGFYATAVETLARRGDVQTVGAGGSIPTDGFGRAETVAVAADQQAVDVLYALPGYLETIGMPLVRGRRLALGDMAESAAAVLSTSAALALFPNEDALGRAFKTAQGRQFTVVGIVGDVPRSLSRQMAPPAYVIPPADLARSLTLVARMRVRNPHALDEMRREVGRLAPGTAVTGVWWSDAIDAQTAYRNPRFQTLVLGTFAVLALGLTALGIFAVVASVVARRIPEMAVRLALGAPPQSLPVLVVRQIVRALLLGLTLGLGLTQGLRRIAEAQLYEVNARDPLTLTVAVFTVCIAAIVAAYLPARYASRVDPMVTLRSE